MAFLQAAHHLVEVEARRLLPLRKIPEAHQEIADIVLGWHHQKSMIDQPVVVGVGRYVGTLIWICLPGTASEPTPYLGYSQASGLGRIIVACGGLAIGATATGLTSHLAAALATMARDGHGVAWLPLTLAAEDLERGRLVRAGPERFDIPVEIRLYRPPGRRSDAAEELWEVACHSPQERR